MQLQLNLTTLDWLCGQFCPWVMMRQERWDPLSISRLKTESANKKLWHSVVRPSSDLIITAIILISDVDLDTNNEKMKNNNETLTRLSKWLKVTHLLSGLFCKNCSHVIKRQSSVFCNRTTYLNPLNSTKLILCGPCQRRNHSIIPCWNYSVGHRQDDVGGPNKLYRTTSIYRCSNCSSPIWPESQAARGEEQ